MMLIFNDFLHLSLINWVLSKVKWLLSSHSWCLRSICIFKRQIIGKIWLIICSLCTPLSLSKIRRRLLLSLQTYATSYILYTVIYFILIYEFLMSSMQLISINILMLQRWLTVCKIINSVGLLLYLGDCSVALEINRLKLSYSVFRAAPHILILEDSLAAAWVLNNLVKTVIIFKFPGIHMSS